MADIRNPDAFVSGRWTYDRHGYSTAFGGSITPGDIDAVVERNHHFLFLEHKEWREGVPPFYMPTGQSITLRRLAGLPKVTVLYICGVADDGDPRYIRCIAPRMENDRTIDLRKEASAQNRHTVLYGLLTDWWHMAEAATGGIP